MHVTTNTVQQVPRNTYARIGGSRTEGGGIKKN